MNSFKDDNSHLNINLETAKIPWKDLQRFFAGGLALTVSVDLDLVDVAYQCSRDNKNKVEEWMRENKLSRVSDKLAKEWIDTDAEVWAVVVKPWVLVQGAGSG